MHVHRRQRVKTIYKENLAPVLQCREREAGEEEYHPAGTRVLKYIILIPCS